MPLPTHLILEIVTPQGLLLREQVDEVIAPGEEGFCGVLPDRVNVLAELGERAEDIDVGRAAEAKTRAEERMKRIADEAGYKEARAEYIKSVTRLAVAERQHV